MLAVREAPRAVLLEVLEARGQRGPASLVELGCVRLLVGVDEARPAHVEDERDAVAVVEQAVLAPEGDELVEGLAGPVARDDPRGSRDDVVVVVQLRLQHGGRLLLVEPEQEALPTLPGPEPRCRGDVAGPGDRGAITRW